MRRLLLWGLMALIATTGHAQEQQKLSARSSTLLKRVTEKPDSIVSAYLTVDPETIDYQSLNECGVQVTMDLGDILTLRLPLSQIENASTVKGVKYLQTASTVKPMLDIARDEVMASAVQRGDGLEKPYTGKGVIIGIVDSGFDYEHAAFCDSEGHLRISRVWEQSSTSPERSAAPEPFGYGVELSTPEAIFKAKGDIYNNSHGSHVTSIAAGSDPYLDGALRGMAPDAEIVLVSMVHAGANNVCISDAISYIYQYAASVGKPCVINLSLGNHNGPHDGTSTFDVLADRMQGQGQLIVGAAGNYRKNIFHLDHSFADANEAPLKTFIDYQNSMTEKNKGGDIDVWAEAGADIEVALVVYKVSPLSEVERVAVYSGTPHDAEEVSLGRNINGAFIAAAEVSQLNGKVHVALTSEVISIRTGYAIALEISSKTAGRVNVWSDENFLGFTSRSIEGFAEPNGSTICEIGGTANRILTVGAYTTRNEYLLMGESTPRHLDETDGTLCSFSCSGPTADGRMKPQVTAPGCFISGAVSAWDSSGTLSYSAYHNANGCDNFYGYMQGTSMAAPMVTGIVATWLEAYPQMTPEELVEIVKTTTRTDEYTGELSSGSDKWGYGKIDALAGIKECLRRTESIGSITVDDQKEVTILNDGRLMLHHDVKQLNVEVYTASGACVNSFMIHNAKAGEIFDLNLASGLYVVRCESHNKLTNHKILK